MSEADRGGTRRDLNLVRYNGKSHASEVLAERMPPPGFDSCPSYWHVACQTAVTSAGPKSPSINTETGYLSTGEGFELPQIRHLMPHLGRDFIAAIEQIPATQINYRDKHRNSFPALHGR